MSPVNPRPVTMGAMWGLTQAQLLWLALTIALVVGVLVGGGVRLAYGRRTHLSWSASILAGIFGAFISTTAGVLLSGGFAEFHPLGALAAAIVGTTIVMYLATRFSRPPVRTAEQLLAGGEAADVEFKSTARRNLHTGKRDEKIELVIAKTIAALANGDGGSLLIGVADDGEVLGLDNDLPLMKQPDVDRYELWLRDYLSQVLGGAAASAVKVSFPVLAGHEICLVRVPEATRPVFVTPGKGDGPQLWARVGNSTRQLPLDQALAYASDRFGRRGLRVR